MLMLTLLACGGAPSSVTPPGLLPPFPTARTPVVADGTASKVVAQNPSGKRVYYDAVHGSRHLHDRDNRRYRTDYHTVSGWFRFLQGLRTAGYQVHAEDHACFDRATLDAYDIYVIGEQTYHARFLTDDERKALQDWVADGGSLFLTVEHTNAHYMGDNFNLLAKPLPVQARFDSICDTETSHTSARDWVELHPKGEHPVTEGVDSYWFYNGCSLDTEHGVLVSSDSSWSDAYVKADKPVHNGNKKLDPGEKTGSLAGIAAFEHGKGRVVVIADHNGLSNTELYVADHHRFAMNAMRWLAHADEAWTSWSYPDGYDLWVHTPPGSGFALHHKADEGTYRTLYEYWGKEPQLRTWANERLEAGHEALILGAPTIAYTPDELKTIDGYLAGGKPVIWAVTLASMPSKAAVQLQQHFGVKLVADASRALDMRRPLEVHGPAIWTAGVLRMFAPKGMPAIQVLGAEPVVQLGHGAWHVDQVHTNEPAQIDLIARKQVGAGTLYVIAPLDLFDDASLPEADKQDVVRQQAGELAIRMMKLPVGDTTLYED